MRREKIIEYVSYIVFALCLFKLLYVQTIDSNKTQNLATDLWYRSFPISYTRGMIVDCNGEAICLDYPSTSIMAIPSLVTNKKESAQILASILQAPENEIEELLNKHVSSIKFKSYGKHLTEEQIKKIEEAAIDGVYFVRDSKRYYPYGETLSQVIGFTGIDNQGLSGLEKKYDSLLLGKQGSIELPFDAHGNEMEELEEKWIESGEGLNVMLTIDMNIQNIIERELNNAYAYYEPKQAWALAMNPNTGEILAIVSKPGFDPNHYQDYSSELINQNLPIFNSYEPGSTFKIITFAAALNENVIDMEKDTYYDRGYEIVSGARIRSWKAGGHGLQTFLEVLQNSSNPGFVEISRRLGTDTLYEYIKKFGFGEKTGVDLIGESKGIMFSKENFHELECATTAFGQGISLTAIQLVRAVSATVNGGILYRPYITKAILHPLTNEVLYENQPIQERRVITEETSMKMRYALEHVVSIGGGKQAYIEGYRIGGKTGTAQKAMNGIYSTSEYILSFIGIAPIDNPQIVLYIALDSPKNPVQYGGTVVAPIAKKCFENILPYLNITQTTQGIQKAYAWNETPKVLVENYVGKSRKDLKSSKYSFDIYGEGDEVLLQLPSASSYIEQGGTVWIYMGEKDDINDKS